jgi:TatD DNase family protein
VVDICKAAGLDRVVFHCFTGTRGDLEKLLDAGFVVSFSGIVTFPSSQLHALVPLVPIDRLLVETDSPYLSPVPLRGSRNEPSRVALVGAAVAAMRAEEPESLAAAVRATFARLFQPQRRGTA